jgi:hypothetical protein
MGEAGSAAPTVEGFSEIRKSILENKKKVAAFYGNDPKKTLVVVIKPTSGSTYKNFVDIMDELNIAQITAAPAIDDENILDSEIAVMKQNGAL